MRSSESDVSSSATDVPSNDDLDVGGVTGRQLNQITASTIRPLLLSSILLHLVLGPRFIPCQRYIGHHVNTSFLCKNSAFVLPPKTDQFALNLVLWPSLCNIRLPIHWQMAVYHRHVLETSHSSLLDNEFQILCYVAEL